jgi:hypothetical protein
MHSSSSPNLHSSGFTVAGMPGSTTSTGQSSWNNPATGSSSFGVSLSDSLNQSRAHYQPGYLMVRFFSKLLTRVIVDDTLQSASQSSASLLAIQPKVQVADAIQ